MLLFPDSDVGLGRTLHTGKSALQNLKKKNLFLRYNTNQLIHSSSCWSTGADIGRRQGIPWTNDQLAKPPIS